jgi:hypothetical protein
MGCARGGYSAKPVGQALNRNTIAHFTRGASRQIDPVGEGPIRFVARTVDSAAPSTILKVECFSDGCAVLLGRAILIGLPNHRRRFIGSLACGLAVWLLAALSAEASCGDWLVGHVSDSLQANVVNEHAAATPAPCPCRGAECRRSPVELPAVPIREVTLAERDVAVLVDDEAAPAAVEGRFARPQSYRLPDRAARGAPLRPPCA